MMRLYLTLFAALAAWSIAIYKFRMMQHSPKQPTDWPITLKMWSATVCGGLAVTLLIDPVYVTVDKLLAMPNLAWLLAYLIGSSAFYLIGTINIPGEEATKRHTQQFLWVIFILLLPAFVVIYLAAIHNAPEWPARTPRNLPEAVFSLLFFGYGALIGALSLTIPIRTWYRDPLLPSRLRSLGGILMVVMANLCFWFKLAYVGASYLHPDIPGIKRLDQIAIVAMGCAALAFGLTFLPHKVYLTLADALTIHSKLKVLQDLEYLRASIHQLCPAIPWYAVPWWERWQNVDFHIYRTVINILDGYKIMTGYLDNPSIGGDAEQPVPVIYPQPMPLNGRPAWSLAEVQRAKFIQTLLDLAQDVEYEKLIAQLHTASRAIRTGENKRIIRSEA